MKHSPICEGAFYIAEKEGAMKVSFSDYRRKLPAVGWIVWEIDCWTQTVRLCRWWAYPFKLIYVFFRSQRVGLYHWFNKVGIMKTPLGCHMRFSDIWKRDKKS